MTDELIKVNEEKFRASAQSGEFDLVLVIGSDMHNGFCVHFKTGEQLGVLITDNDELRIFEQVEVCVQFLKANFVDVFSFEISGWGKEYLIPDAG